MVKTGRLSGVLLPLFSLRSHSDFGIGDFGAAGGFLDWLAAGRQRLWMVLPLLPTAPNDTSPYATRSAFGLNPLFIHLDDVPEYAEAGGLNSLLAEERAQLEEARSSVRIRYDLATPLKMAALRRAFARFRQGAWAADSGRAQSLRQYAREQSAWLEPYSAFAAICEAQGQKGFWEWEPAGLREAKSLAVAQEKGRLADEILFHQWLQWVAHEQWRKVRVLAGERGVLLCGDEPFIVSQNSADVWANPGLLRRDARLGVPPDAFSSTGQDWGLPYFDTPAMAKDDYAWLKFRGQNAATYFDLRRVDHAVGYFRQWIRDPKTPTGRFVPAEEKEQRALGRTLFGVFQKCGPTVVAEDLGIIPEWVRTTLGELQIPGYKVLRWERDGATYRDPTKFAAASLVTTGTHDTSTLKEWWEDATALERTQVTQAYAELKEVTVGGAFSPQIHRALLQVAQGSGSDLCVLPYQDVLGTAERVNLPGSIGASNWSYRLDLSSDQLTSAAPTRAAAQQLAELSAAAQR